MNNQENQIVIYQSGDVEISLSADPAHDTIWATHQQIADLFDIDRSGATRHINNILQSGEVDQENNVQKMHIANAKRPVTFYSLDMILSVGYRTNSSKAIDFRRWANQVLRNYILTGAAVNQRRLEQLGAAIQILARADDDMVSGIADVLDHYTEGLELLEKYDDRTLSVPKGTISSWELDYQQARALIDAMPMNRANGLFGVEKDESFQSALGAIYQTFGGEDLYPSVQEKASNLLYLMVKNHPFNDGNKRIAAAIFVYFLDRNGILFDSAGRQVIANNALAAITLMIALSHPEEKENMCLLVMNMLGGHDE